MAVPYSHWPDSFIQLQAVIIGFSPLCDLASPPALPPIQTLGPLGHDMKARRACAIASHEKRFQQFQQ